MIEIDAPSWTQAAFGISMLIYSVGYPLGIAGLLIALVINIIDARKSLQNVEVAANRMEAIAFLNATTGEDSWKADVLEALIGKYLEEHE